MIFLTELLGDLFHELLDSDRQREKPDELLGFVVVDVKGLVIVTGTPCLLEHTGLQNGPRTQLSQCCHGFGSEDLGISREASTFKAYTQWTRLQGLYF